MTDRRKIVALWQQGNAVALATLIRVEGSSYRRTGARLLIAADGTYAGSISGGCLEAEVIRKAQWLVRSGANIQRYSTLFDDTADIPYGLGCGGTVDVLLEPANTPECTALMQALEVSLHGQTLTIETHLPSANHQLRRKIEARNSQPATGLGAVDLSHVELGAGSPPLSRDNQQTFHETLHPPQRLILFGAGDDAQPMLQLATLLGWNTTIVDSRPQWATPARFPQAEAVLCLVPATQAPEARSIPAWGEAPRTSRLADLRAGSPIYQLAEITVTPNDAVVLMTHSYEQDRAWLTTVLPSRPRYLGLLGARHRSALLISEAATLLGWPIDQACEHIFAPVGLDLGGDGAESIALATIAEIQACLEGKLGHSRHMNATLIAEQIQQGGASRYLQAQCAL